MNMKAKKVLTIVGLVLGAVAFFLAGFYVRPQYEKRQFSGSTTPAKQFVQKVTAGDTNGAYALTSKSLQSRQSKEEFTQLVAPLKADKPEFNAGQAVRSGNSIVYYQRVLNMPASSGGSTNAEFYITLEKDGDNWKVATVSVQ